MQLLPPVTRDQRVISREQSAGRHLGYARHVDDHTIETRDGLLLQFIQLRGLLFETADTEELNYRKQLREGMLQAIGTSRFGLYHHILRRRIDLAFNGEFPDNFSQGLHDRWNARLAGRQLFVNDLFLTIARRPTQGRIGLLESLRDALTPARDTDREGVPHEVRQLDNATEALMASLGSYEPKLLSVYNSLNEPYSEPLEFLSALFNGEMRPVKLPAQDLGEYLPYRRVSFGQDAIELGPTGNSPREFAALVSIKDYPGQTSAGMFDELLRLPFEMVISQSFGFVDRQAALSRMNLALRRMRSRSTRKANGSTSQMERRTPSPSLISIPANRNCSD